MSPPLPFTTLDVFTLHPFRGNQLAVIYLTHPLPHATKQAIAHEFNLSETIFLHETTPPSQHTPSEDSINTTTAPPIQTHHLETFTTTEELPFAGHPTVGAIHHLCTRASPPLAKVNLTTKAGLISGSYDSASNRAQAALPHNLHIHTTLVAVKAVLSTQPALAALATTTSIPDAPVVSLVKGLSFTLVDLSSRPSALKELRGSGQRIEPGAVAMDEGWAPSFVGVYYFVVTARDEGVYRIKARMLEEGIGEDAATGSAASCLAGYLALQDGREGGLYEFTVEQGVELGRASEIAVTVKLGGGGRVVKSVTLGGSAVIVTEGKIHVPGL